MAETVNVDIYRRRPEEEIKKVATAMSISLSISYEEIIAGWEGKAKGYLQVAWERGSIDESNLTSYLARGGKYDQGNTLDEKYCLHHIISQLDDFANETTLLQDTLAKHNVIFIRTPKCHPELAGEGIIFKE